jgi:hypothetical protein
MPELSRSLSATWCFGGRDTKAALYTRAAKEGRLRCAEGGHEGLAASKPLERNSALVTG